MFKRNLSVGDVVGYRTAKHWDCVYKAYVVELDDTPLKVGLAVNLSIGTVPSSSSNIDEWFPVEASIIDVAGYWDRFESQIAEAEEERATVKAWRENIQQRSTNAYAKLQSMGINVKPPMLGNFTISIEQLEKLLDVSNA